MTDTAQPRTDGRRLSESEQRALRVRALAAHAEGVKPGAIARTLGMSRQWVWKVLRAAQAEGEAAAVAGGRRGPKAETVRKMHLLTPDEEQRIRGTVMRSAPRSPDGSPSLWTREAVLRLIRSATGGDAAVRTAGGYLKRWRMTPPHPKVAALESAPERSAAGAGEALQDLQNRAKSERGLILWLNVPEDADVADEASPRPSVMLQAADNQGKRFFLFREAPLTARSVIVFLHRLAALHPGRRLVILCDDASIGRASGMSGVSGMSGMSGMNGTTALNAVKTWAARRAPTLDLVFLSELQH